MKTRHFVLAMLSSLFVSCAAFADRQLDRAEILQIFQKLTSQPRKTWIPAGIIEATHEEYRSPKVIDPNEIERQIKERVQEYQNNPNKPELTENLQKMKLDSIPFDVRYRLSNEYTMNSTVVVRFDGERFYWEINVQSRTDSIKPDKDLEDNFMTRQFDLGWNARRIFVWDGEKYTTYFLPGNHAIVDSTGQTPHVVNGPLTAGFIPWGYGYYSYESLAAADSSADEKYIDGQTQIHLTLNKPDGSEMVFALDPGKNYAVMSCSITKPGNLIIAKQYSDYQLVSGNWAPATILIEQYEPGPKRLLASDLWHFTKISGDIPSRNSFDVEYENDALIEYRSAVTDNPLMYRHSPLVNTDLLLAERLTFAASEGAQPQNCATIALKYVASQLGKAVTDQELVQLVSEPDKTTSLYAMKQFAESRGFYCRAVKTDIKTLKGLNGCQVILHIPAKNHFVVLAGIDREYVWCIDLTNDKFYYRTDIDFFGMDWTEGTALLVSNRPIQGNFTEIDDDQLSNIIGGAGYTCTRLLQTYNVIFCSQVGGECGGKYQEYLTRYGCEAAESGSCTGSKMLRYKESPCIEDPYDPLACTVTGEWTCYYMKACA
jgi:hypothetical protein